MRMSCIAGRRPVHGYLAVMLALLWTLLAAPGRAAAATGTEPQAAAPQTYYFLVFSNPAAGQEAEYNRWYSDEHAPDVVSIPGFVSARRYIYNDVQLRAVALRKPRYLIVFKIVTRDLAGVSAEVLRRLKSGQTRGSASFDGTSALMFTYRALRPPLSGAGGDAPDAQAGAQATYLQVVFGDATAGMDRQFNQWYDQVHAPQMLATPGFVAAQRAVLSDVQVGPTIRDPSHYLALFTIRTRDLPAVLRHVKGEEPPPAFDRSRTFGYTYRAIGPALSGNAVRAQRARAAAAAH